MTPAALPLQGRAVFFSTFLAGPSEIAPAHDFKHEIFGIATLTYP
jgi:hypothetical protein